MKSGKSLQELAIEIERQAKSKKDYIASTEAVELKPIDGGMTVTLGDKGTFAVGDIAHGQIATHTNIPQRYYDRMRSEAPDLLVGNVERWFKKYPSVRMNRTLDGKLRAMLSDRYMPFDNFDFAAATLPILRDRGLEIMSCEITDRNLYIKAIDKQLWRDVPVGYKMGDGSHKFFHTVAPAVIMRNSEVGYGRLVIEDGVYTEVCTNLAMFGKGFKRTHVGARHQLTENFGVDDLDSILSNEAKQKTLEATWLQARDVLKNIFDAKSFAKRCEQLEATAKNELPAGNVEKVLEVVQEKHALTGGERNDIFKFLIEGGNLSQYGLHAAITRASQEADSYDRATELEELGGKIVELPRTEWRKLAEAA